MPLRDPISMKFQDTEEYRLRNLLNKALPSYEEMGRELEEDFIREVEDGLNRASEFGYVPPQLKSIRHFESGLKENLDDALNILLKMEDMMRRLGKTEMADAILDRSEEVRWLIERIRETLQSSAEPIREVVMG